MLCACAGNESPTSAAEDETGPIPLELQDAFLNLEFENVTALSGAPAGPPRLYVAERRGYIHAFDNDLQVEGTFPLMDIQDRVLDDGEAGGLRGFAFHPGWATTGELFVHYVAGSPRRSVISRFRLRADDPDRIDEAGEEILLEIDQPDAANTGGALTFGPDGYLYLALGDGGPAGDPGDHGQDRSTLRGSVLRLDVNGSSGGYSVPEDNPLEGNDLGLRSEIFAWGFRGPTGLAFDPGTGHLWLADQGAAGVEEVNIVETGGNYGWKIAHGHACYAPPSGCDLSGLIPPIFDYGRGGFPQSVIGGAVYRSERNPELQGRYIMADGPSGQVWAVDFDGSSASGEQLLQGPPGFSAMGVDANGEIHFANDEDGRIYRFRYTAN